MAARYRQRWRAEQTIEELLHGHDLDHLLSYRLHPNRVAICGRVLALPLAMGVQMHAADARPRVIRELQVFRAQYVDGLGSYTVRDGVLILHPLHPSPPAIRE